MAQAKDDIVTAHAKLRKAKSAWHLLADGESFFTKSSLLQPVIYAGIKGMLKIPMCIEERRAAALMICWNGNGAAKVLQRTNDAILMERAMGKRSLRHMVENENEDEANEIICSVAAQLHSAQCQGIKTLLPLAIWFRSLPLAAEKHGGIFHRCAKIADRLLKNPIDIVALHGDIHHDNILDNVDDWVAIDPKSLLGERAFDFANLFCNPTPEIALCRDRLRKQTKLIADEAGIDAERLLQWIAAWSGLSASWALEDDEDASVQIAVAEMAFAELGEKTG
jgi:streptomycin 6-kinase